MKTCKICGEEKPLNEYHKKKDTKDGHDSRCKKCKSEKAKDYYSENKDKILECQKEYHSENRDKSLERSKKYYYENKDKISEKKKEYYFENRDKRLEQMKDYYHENRERKKCLRLQRKYGITLDEYNQMFTDQNGCCAICGKHNKEKTRSLAVDHDHETGEVRELLCTSCNTSLGLLQENEEILLSMLAYIRRHK